MQKRHTDRERYFRELAQTSREFYIDYLRKFKNVGAEHGCWRLAAARAEIFCRSPKRDAA